MQDIYGSFGQPDYDLRLLQMDMPRQIQLNRSSDLCGYISPNGKYFQCTHCEHEIFVKKIVADNYKIYFDLVIDAFYDSMPTGMIKEEYFIMKILGYIKISSFKEYVNQMYLFTYYNLTSNQTDIVYPHSQNYESLSYFEPENENISEPEKSLSWEEVYQKLIGSEFGFSPKINIPFDNSLLTEEAGLANECYRKYYMELKSKGFVRVYTHIRNKDQYIFVYFGIGSYDVSFDEDGFGGGTIDEYAFGVIDAEGRWAYPLSYCKDLDLMNLFEIDSQFYLPEEQRLKVWHKDESFSIL